MIRTSYYKIVRKNNRYVEFHLVDGEGKTLAIGDFTITEWSQMDRFLPVEFPPMSMATDHAVITGSSRW